RARSTLSASFKITLVELLKCDFTLNLLSQEPQLWSGPVQTSDKFIIFGSGGFWKLITDEEAAAIVNTNPREGIAKRLVRIALETAARENNISYSEFLTKPVGTKFFHGQDAVEGIRRANHDDISITVIFLDGQLMNTSVTNTNYYLPIF
ncbi:hypothetical protein RYX36_031052, partial [Vicia faba]